MFGMNLLGPQNSAASQLNITASGGETTFPSTTLDDVRNVFAR